MRPNYWKLLGVAGVAGVAATGVVVARRRRAHAQIEPDAIRERLHARLAEVSRADEPWWKTAVVYQVYPRSFADADGDGIGDLAGLESRLDYLAQLGVDVIWLSPVYPSPQDDNGYDISDYQDIEPVFGTLAGLDRLLGEIHARGLKLGMDLVVNHTSSQHPWFLESRGSRENPKRDWYWWRDEPPNDWRSFFSGPGWELDDTTAQYYLHLFARSQPDLNWENEAVREAIYSMMRWWLDRGVDGFRMDVINMISKDLENGFICGPRIHEFLHEMHEAVFAGRDEPTLTVGESVVGGAEVADADRGRDAGLHGRAGAALHRPRARRGRHGLPVRARAGRHGRDALGPPRAEADRPQALARPLAEGARGARLELAVLEQPRPAAGRLPLRRRLARAPRALGEDARHGPAPPPRDAVRVPGRGARDDQRALRRDRRVPGHRVAEPLRGGDGRRRRSGRGAGVAADHEP